MAWSQITVLETAPGARILKSLMFRMRDNPIACADQTDVSVPTSERPRLPECLITTTTATAVALASDGPGNQCQFVATPKWHLAAFQTPGAWSLAGGVGAREYIVEMWGAGASGSGNATRVGGGSGSYVQVMVPAGAGVAIGGVVGAGGAAPGVGGAANAGGNTTLATGPGTATAYGAPAGGAGAAMSIYGGASVFVYTTTGFDSEANIAGGVGPPGAPAPMIGGASATNTAGAVANGAVGSGGAASLSSGVGPPQPGADGMVLVWYLE